MGLQAPVTHRIEAHLQRLYGPERLTALSDRMRHLVDEHLRLASPLPARPSRLSERDAVLILYADQVQAEGELPLETLKRFLKRRISGLISGVHLLPFYPASSDDGFAVIDYREVDPQYGSWQQVRSIAGDYRLMVDAVINHVSSQHPWFKDYLAGEAEEMFIEVDPRADLSQVVRPRDLPLLTPFQSINGQKHVWTTFSADQIDLNFQNPEVLLRIIDLLLFYIRQGAQILRLDAIAYLWKQVGTSSIHLEQTHEIVRLFRTLLDAVAPGVLILTETNVPHRENISYFGDGTDEAHMVYQFALPPLILHSLIQGNSIRLNRWLRDYAHTFPEATFFNFLASHDGIGLSPARGILEQAEIDVLVELAEARGGGVSYRALGSSGRQPYELNLTYLDALTPLGEAESDPARTTARFLCSQAIMLSLAGVPGIYFHSLFGSRNDPAGVEQTGRLRSINREKQDSIQLEKELAQRGSLRSRIFTGYAELIVARTSHPAFSPFGGQELLEVGPDVFAVLRRSEDGARRALCLHELTGFSVEVEGLGMKGSAGDMITGDELDLRRIPLEPYQVRWLSLE